MEYKGKLYAKLGAEKYIALEETSDDFDKLKAENETFKQQFDKLKMLSIAYKCALEFDYCPKPNKADYIECKVFSLIDKL